MIRIWLDVAAHMIYKFVSWFSFKEILSDYRVAVTSKQHTFETHVYAQRLPLVHCYHRSCCVSVRSI